MGSYAHGLEFARPTPAHALTPGAEEAVEIVRRAGFEKRMSATVSSLAADHGHKRIVPHDGDVVTDSARALTKKAERFGFTVKIFETVTGCRVEGVHAERGVGFRAYWERGKAAGGTWHEARDRYVLVTDTRPVGVNKLTRTGLAGKRPAGLGAVHLKLVASRAGIPHNVTEIERKVSE